MSKRQQEVGSVAIGRLHSRYAIQRRNRHWEVRDAAGDLVCLTVYKRGAQEVIRRISRLELAAARIDSHPEAVVKH